MSSAKNATRGPWIVDASDEDAIEVVGTPAWGCERFGKRGRWSVCTLDDLMGDHPKEVKANARLIAEAGTALHETGLTPRQLAEQRAELLDQLKVAAARAEAAEAECARLKRDVAELYEAMPSLPIAAETMDAATDWFTRYCVDFSREINAAQDAVRTKEETK